MPFTYKDEGKAWDIFVRYVAISIAFMVHLKFVAYHPGFDITYAFLHVLDGKTDLWWSTRTAYLSITSIQLVWYWMTTNYTWDGIEIGYVTILEDGTLLVEPSCWVTHCLYSHLGGWHIAYVAILVGDTLVDWIIIIIIMDTWYSA